MGRLGKYRCSSLGKETAYECNKGRYNDSYIPLEYTQG